MTAIHKAIQDYLAAQATEGKAQRTLEVYRARLRHFADWFASRGKTETRSLSAADPRAFTAHLQANGNGTGTPRQNAVMVKAFSKWPASRPESAIIQRCPFQRKELKSNSPRNELSAP